MAACGIPRPWLVFVAIATSVATATEATATSATAAGTTATSATAAGTTATSATAAEATATIDACKGMMKNEDVVLIAVCEAAVIILLFCIIIRMIVINRKIMATNDNHTKFELPCLNTTQPVITDPNAPLPGGLALPIPRRYVPISSSDNWKEPNSHDALNPTFIGDSPMSVESNETIPARPPRSSNHIAPQMNGGLPRSLMASQVRDSVPVEMAPGIPYQLAQHKPQQRPRYSSEPTQPSHYIDDEIYDDNMDVNSSVAGPRPVSDYATPSDEIYDDTLDVLSNAPGRRPNSNSAQPPDTAPECMYSDVVDDYETDDLYENVPGPFYENHSEISSHSEV